MTTIIETARTMGTHAADLYRDEFGRSPAEDGVDDVGDWDAAAWGDNWNELRNHRGATADQYDAALGAWRDGFWGRTPATPAAPRNPYHAPAVPPPAPVNPNPIDSALRSLSVRALRAAALPEIALDLLSARPVTDRTSANLMAAYLERALESVRMSAESCTDLCRRAQTDVAFGVLVAYHCYCLTAANN